MPKTTFNLVPNLTKTFDLVFWSSDHFPYVDHGGQPFFTKKNYKWAYYSWSKLYRTFKLSMDALKSKQSPLWKSSKSPSCHKHWNAWWPYLGHLKCSVFHEYIFLIPILKFFHYSWKKYFCKLLLLVDTKPCFGSVSWPLVQEHLCLIKTAFPI